MVLFIRDNECFEPRVKNYLHYFDTHNIPYHVIAWNRDGTAQPNEHITFFQRRSSYGKRIKNIPNKLLWMFFVMRQIRKHRKSCTAIHACDIDAILPALLMGKLTRKTVIFDIFDWISSLTGKGFVYRIVEFFQNSAYKRSDHIILCEEERKAQAKAKNDSVHVLPNIPNIQITYDKDTAEAIQEQRTSHRLVVSYVGVFDRDRGLENLLDCVSKLPDILLNIAGFGVLDEQIRGYADKYPNICYWGRVEYAVGQTIMKHSDLMAAMYHLTSPLHKYAAPNKYYESLILEVPMITTKNTLVGSKVQTYDTGFVIGEDPCELANLLSNHSLLQQAKLKRLNCHTTWEQIYKNYYDDYMQKEYQEMIR